MNRGNKVTPPEGWAPEEWEDRSDNNYYWAPYLADDKTKCMAIDIRVNAHASVEIYLPWDKKWWHSLTLPEYERVKVLLESI